MKNPWVSDKTNFIPDFIIGGAMKCGTSTLHTILSKHPKIFIPDGEIGFFDIDNILQHSDFNFYHNKRWTIQSMEKNPQKVWDWYHKKFEESGNLIKGEDSTTYLASKSAAERISMQRKDIKLLFLLRQPSLRAYSNYNHLLKSGRATNSFEDTIRFNPFNVINRSLYKDQLENFYRKIPRERIKVILFEDLIKNPETVIEEVSRFLGIEYGDFPQNIFETHSNKSTALRNTKLQQRKNLLVRNFDKTRYTNTLPFVAPIVMQSTPFIGKVINKVHSKINPKVPHLKKINPETKSMLDDYFYREMIGIDELTGKDILSRWFPDKKSSTLK